MKMLNDFLVNAREYVEKFKSGEKFSCSVWREQSETVPLVNRKSVERHVSDIMIEADNLSLNSFG